MFTRIAARARHILQSEEGAVAIQIGLIIVAMIGMAALAVDFGFALFKHRQMQSAADGAAFSAVTAKVTKHPAAFSVEADAVAANVGFVNGANGVTVIVNNPPASGAYAGNASAVEVIVEQPENLPLVSSFGALIGAGVGPINVAARAVASQAPADYCMLALNGTGTAFSVQGNVTVGNPNCGIADNSTNNNAAAHLQGSVTVDGPLSVSGGIQTTGGAFTIDNTPPFPEQNAPAVPDPYAPAPNGNGEKTNLTSQYPKTACNPSTTLVAGQFHYCNLSGSQTFSAGTYFIDTSITIGGNNVFTATAAPGVTLVLGANFNNFKVSGNPTIAITAPTSGNFAGLALASLSNVAMTFVGTTTLTGGIYVPNGTVQMNGNVSSPCAQIIAGSIILNGDVNLNNNGDCGLQTITSPGSVQLVQ